MGGIFGVHSSFKEFFVRISRLLNDQLKGSLFQVAIVKGNGNPNGWLCRMLQDVMAAGHVMNKEPSPFKRPDQLFWSDGW